MLVGIEVSFMRSTQLWAYTLALREEFPAAKELRIRKAQKPDRTVWQLVGYHPKHGRIAKKIPATTESEVFQGARSLMEELETGRKGRPVPVGANKRIERAAVDGIVAKGLRDATTRSQVGHVRQLISFMEDRSLRVDEYNLKVAIEGLAPDRTQRTRRAVLEAARKVAKIAKVELDTEGLTYIDSLPERRPDISDEVLFRRLDQSLPKIGAEGAAWVFRVIAVLGIRGNGALSLNVDWFEHIDCQPGDQLLYWDSKRNRQAFTTPTIRDWWGHWKLNDRPACLDPFLMPHDRPATNDQIHAANTLLTNYSALLRRKVNKNASETIGFRALRHQAGARLLESGMDLLAVSELLSTSIAQLERTYASKYRSRAIKEAGNRL